MSLFSMAISVDVADMIIDSLRGLEDEVESKSVVMLMNQYQY